MITRNRVVIAVLLVIAVLFVASAVNGPDGGGDGAALRRPSGLIGWFGEKFGGTPDADQADLSAPCRDGDRLVVKAGTCTLQVARSSTGRRTVRLRTDSDVAVQAPAPGQDTLVRSDARAGDTLSIAVDGDRTDIDLICAGERTCVLTVVRKG